MFTGIIQARGAVRRIETSSGGKRFVIASPAIGDFGLSEGDSVAVSGVCLTALRPASDEFHADLSNETLSLTTLGRCAEGAAVNLEPALKAGDALGGHLVTGHVDGMAVLAAREQRGDNAGLQFEAPETLARYIAVKGSVALDGISLTVNRVDGCRFELNLIPHTLEVTTLGALQPGERVNLEVDAIARYVERLLEFRNA